MTTPTKKRYRKYKALQYTTYTGQFGAIATPYFVMGAVKWNEWFVLNENGWKIGIGGTLAMILLSTAIILVTKQEENKKLTDGYVTLILGWLLTGLIFTLLADIMSQIANIMFFGAIGLAGAFGLNLSSKSYKNKALRIKEASIEVDKKMLQEEIEEERKTIKVKVKK